MKRCPPGSSRSHPLALLVLMLVLSGVAWAGPKYKVLHNFTGAWDGVGPNEPLILDRSGNLYGTAIQGGRTECQYGCGLVYALSPSGGKWKETVVYDFCSQGGQKCPGGVAPVGPLVFDSAGNLYGGNLGGGSGNHGVIFQLSPGSGGWTESVLYQPGFWGFVLDSSGNLYGSIGYGAHDYGAG